MAHNQGTLTFAKDQIGTQGSNMYFAYVNARSASILVSKLQLTRTFVLSGARFNARASACAASDKSTSGGARASPDRDPSGARVERKRHISGMGVLSDLLQQRNTGCGSGDASDIT